MVIGHCYVGSCWFLFRCYGCCYCDVWLFVCLLVVELTCFGCCVCVGVWFCLFVLWWLFAYVLLFSFVACVGLDVCFGCFVVIVLLLYYVWYEITLVDYFDCWSFGGCYFIVLCWVWFFVLVWFMLVSMLIAFIDFGVW